ncbi:hypothetical protein BU24DRAFT_355601, partial [Aaosphaeria arxii CBS 175.79]
HSIPMTTIHHTPPPGASPFHIYEDSDDLGPPSPSEVYDDEMSFNSDPSLPSADEALPSIEDDYAEHDNENDHAGDLEPKPYRGSYTSRPSILSSAQKRHISAVTTTSFISSLPSEVSVASKPISSTNQSADSRYTPRKERPPFRNPSSVRAMQMSSPPPFASYDNPRERIKGTYKLATPSRIRVMPEWLIENYKILEEKLQDIVLMRRGVLIPHPRDEYDLLEERVLESLELKTPRLLKCGHFVPPADSEESSSDEDEETSVAGDSAGRGSRMSGGTLTVDEDVDKPAPSIDLDTSMCMDCHQHMKKPGKGVGLGSRKWDIKIYAANGLMRSGAWAAAWNEMERCDVEISPWIPIEVRKDLERKIKEEAEAKKRKELYQAELKRQVEEEAVRLKKLEEAAVEEKRLAEISIEAKLKAEEIELQRKDQHEAEEKLRFEAALKEKIDEATEVMRLQFESQALAEAASVAERFRALEGRVNKEAESRDAVSTLRSTSRRPRMEELSLGTLLKNYFVLLAKDQRNVFIVILSVVVVYLAMHLDPAVYMQLPASSLPHALPEDRLPDLVSSIVVTTTATTTATAIATSTTTVTHVERYSEIVHDMATSSPEIAISASAEPSPVFSSEGLIGDVPVNLEQEIETDAEAEAIEPSVVASASAWQDQVAATAALDLTDAAPPSSIPSPLPIDEPLFSPEPDEELHDISIFDKTTQKFLGQPMSSLDGVTCLKSYLPAELQAQPTDLLD